MQFLQGDNLPFGDYESLLNKRRAEFEKKNPEKIDYEFQEVGVEMVKWFQPKRPGAVWAVFHKHDLKLIQECFAICKKNDKRSLPYFFGCVKRRSANT
jgi:hypothetical protein